MSEEESRWVRQPVFAPTPRCQREALGAAHPKGWCLPTAPKRVRCPTPLAVSVKSPRMALSKSCRSYLRPWQGLVHIRARAFAKDVSADPRLADSAGATSREQ